MTTLSKEVRQQFLDSRFRILEDVKNGDHAAAVNEMMIKMVPIQKAYKEKVQALIAI